MSFDTVITCHANADNDALASLVGALALYPHAVLLFPGTQEKQVQDFFDEAIEPLYPCIAPRDLEEESVKLLVLVDGHHPSRFLVPEPLGCALRDGVAGVLWGALVPILPASAHQGPAVSHHLPSRPRW